MRGARTKGAVRAAGAISFALLAAVAESAVTVRHEALGCVPTGSYARVSAEFLPVTEVAHAEVRFRVDGASGWYSSRLDRDGNRWSGSLPQPASLQRFEYQIAVTASDLGVVETPVVQVRVSTPDAPCADGGDFSAAVERPIVIRVPEGAPVMPPVPEGFSPTGVIAAVVPVALERRTLKGATVAAIAAGVAAGIGVVSVQRQSDAPPPEPASPSPPEFSIASFAPPPNSIVSVAAGRVEVGVRLAGAVGIPLSFAWRVEFNSRLGSCLTMAGEVSAGTQRPQVFVLAAPLVSTGACGARFDVDSSVLTIRIDGQVAYSWQGERFLRIEP